MESLSPFSIKILIYIMLAKIYKKQQMLLNILEMGTYNDLILISMNMCDNWEISKDYHKTRTS